MVDDGVVNNRLLNGLPSKSEIRRDRQAKKLGLGEGTVNYDFGTGAFPGSAIGDAPFRLSIARLRRGASASSSCR